MKKLLILGLMILIAATAVSAQLQLAKIDYCKYPDGKILLKTGGCANLQTVEDLGYIIKGGIEPPMEYISISECTYGYPPTGGGTPYYERRYAVGVCPSEIRDLYTSRPLIGIPQVIGSAFKKQIEGTKPACGSQFKITLKDCKYALYGFWPQSADFKIPTAPAPAPAPTPAPAPVIAPPIAAPPAEEEICCMITQEKRGEKRAEVEKSTKTRCEEQAKRTENVIETKIIPMEQCRQKVCCERKEGRNSMEYGECIREQGNVADIPLEKCKVEKPPVVQVPAVPAVDCAAIIKENEQLRQQRADLIKKRDELKARLKPIISPPPGKGALESCSAGECKQGLTCFASRCVTLIPLYQCDIKPAFSKYWYDTDPECTVPPAVEGDEWLTKTGTKIGYITKEDPYQEISKTPEGYYTSPSLMLTKCVKGEKQQASNMALRAREYLVSIEKGYPICPPEMESKTLGYAYNKNIQQKTTSRVIPLGEEMWKETFIIPLDYKEG